MKKNYYDILEINKNASQEIVEKAYKTLAKKYHPDLQKENTSEDLETKMKELNEAYEVISNQEKREAYNKKLEEIENFKIQSQFTNSSQNNDYYAREAHNNEKDSQNEFEEEYFKQQAIRQAQFEQEKQEAIKKAYYDAYIQDMKNRGYKIKYKKTLKDYFREFVTIIVIILILLLIIQIPFVKNFFINFYQENEIIKFIVDFIISIFNNIVNTYI